MSSSSSLPSHSVSPPCGRTCAARSATRARPIPWRWRSGRTTSGCSSQTLPPYPRMPPTQPRTVPASSRRRHRSCPIRAPHGPRRAPRSCRARWTASARGSPPPELSGLMEERLVFRREISDVHGWDCSAFPRTRRGSPIPVDLQRPARTRYAVAQPACVDAPAPPVYAVGRSSAVTRAPTRSAPGRMPAASAISERMNSPRQ